MLKLTAAVLTFALVGVANAEGWRSLRIDASSDAAFRESLAAFTEKLSPARQHVFAQALVDIWREGRANAEAGQLEYTADDYHRQLHGLSYEEVVTFTDPTGATAKARYRDAERTHDGAFPSWRDPLGAGRAVRLRRAHQGLDSGAAMQTGDLARQRGR